MIEFEFLRPELLWLALPALLLLALLWFNKIKQSKRHSLISPHLAQFVMTGEAVQKRPAIIWPVLFLFIAILAISGPSWQKHQVPVYQAKHARVLVLDMSSSMYSTDIQPNRLTQARFKALDMVEMFKEGETALVAYAGSAFAISPLTSDAQTLTNLIPSLSPDIMPEKGSNVLAGLTLAKELLQQAGYLAGDIILLTDGIDSEDISDVNQFSKGLKHTLNIYTVATEQGAPIKLPQGGFLKDQYGQIVIPKANFSALHGLTKRTGGVFSSYHADNIDILPFETSSQKDELMKEDSQQTLWLIDGGIYFALFLLPLALIMLRNNRQLLAVAFLMCLILPKEQAFALSWDSIWEDLSQNKDQKALNAYQNENFQNAVNSDLADLKGAAHYKSGDYDNALTAFSKDTSAIGLYNQGNALAQLNRFDEAIQKYEDALKIDPTLTAALENLELLKKLEQQKKQQEQQGEGDNQEQQNSDDKKPSDSEQQNSDSEKSQDSNNNSDEESQEQQSEQSEDSTQNNSQNTDSELTTEEQKEENKSQAAKSDEEQNENENEDENKKQASQTEEQENSKNEQEQQQAQLTQAPELTAEEKEKAQQLSQLLRKVPDDPATLLRNKMQLEYQNRLRQRTPQGVTKSW